MGLIPLQLAYFYERKEIACKRSVSFDYINLIPLNLPYSVLLMNSSSKNKVRLTALASLGAAATSQAVIEIGITFDQSIAGPALGSYGFDPNNSPTNSGSFDWDVDGNGSDEINFSLEAYGFNYNDASQEGFRKINAGSAAGGFAFFTNGGSLAFSSAAIADAANTNYVNAFNLFNYGTAYTGSTRQVSSPSMSSGITVGFKFDRNGSTHYGIADLSYGNSIASFDNGTPLSLILDNVRWNNVAGQGITGAGIAVPEPASLATGLGLLALGAAGLRAWRRQPRSA